jgi:hypothetical protein
MPERLQTPRNFLYRLWLYRNAQIGKPLPQERAQPCIALNLCQKERIGHLDYRDTIM